MTGVSFNPSPASIYSKTKSSTSPNIYTQVQSFASAAAPAISRDPGNEQNPSGELLSAACGLVGCCCAVVVGAVGGAGYLVYKGVSGLLNQGKQEEQ